MCIRDRLYSAHGTPAQQEKIPRQAAAESGFPLCTACQSDKTRRSARPAPVSYTHLAARRMRPASLPAGCGIRLRPAVIRHGTVRRPRLSRTGCFISPLRSAPTKMCIRDRYCCYLRYPELLYCYRPLPESQRQPLHSRTRRIPRGVSPLQSR